MAFDDPVVWIMIIALAVFLFGSGKIPQFAKALGEAKREFDSAWRGFGSMTAPITQQPAQQQQPRPPPAVANAVSPEQSPGSTPQPLPPAQAPAPDATNQSSVSSGNNNNVNGDDHLIIAAKSEGIVTEGKTREQIATELAIKLNNAKHAAETSA